MIVSIALRIEAELCGPVSVGTVSVIKLIAQHLALGVPAAMALVDRCVFDGETVTVSAPSREAATSLIRAFAALPPVPRVSAEIIRD